METITAITIIFGCGALIGFGFGISIYVAILELRKRTYKDGCLAGLMEAEAMILGASTVDSEKMKKIHNNYLRIKK
jgi:hypothetical protein